MYQTSRHREHPSSNHDQYKQTHLLCRYVPSLEYQVHCAGKDRNIVPFYHDVRPLRQGRANSRSSQAEPYHIRWKRRIGEGRKEN